MAQVDVEQQRLQGAAAAIAGLVHMHILALRCGAGGQHSSCPSQSRAAAEPAAATAEAAAAAAAGEQQQDKPPQHLPSARRILV